MHIKEAQVFDIFTSDVGEEKKKKRKHVSFIIAPQSGAALVQICHTSLWIEEFTKSSYYSSS